MTRAASTRCCSPDTGATGDTGAVELDCADAGPPRVEGHGCGSLTNAEETCGPDGLQTSGGPHVEGTGASEDCGCSAPVGAAPLWVIPLVWALRRILVVMAVLLPVSAEAVDTQVSHADGADWPLLWDAGARGKWSPAALFALDWARKPVVLVQGGRKTVLLNSVLTRELAASIDVAGVVDVGFSYPVHTAIVFEDRLQGRSAGDLTTWVKLPLRLGHPRYRVAWMVQLDVPTGIPQLWLGDRQGGVVGRLAGDMTLFGPVQLGANLGLRGRALEILPGLLWKNRVELGGGLRFVQGPVAVTTELVASAPVGQYKGPQAAYYPIEAVLAVGGNATDAIRITAGGGSGITRGLGSPSSRVFAQIDVRQRPSPDTDGDGIVDLRDACRTIPEDKDAWEDRDGCPDTDNDDDGFLDVDDLCPDEPEVFNEHLDEDGCPDRIRVLRVTVQGEGLQVVRLVVGEDAAQTIGGETTDFRIPVPLVRIAASAPGFHPASDEIDMEDGDLDVVDVTLTLEPIVYGTVELDVVDAEGNALEALVQEGEDVTPIDGPLQVAAGPWSVNVLARVGSAASR